MKHMLRHNVLVKKQTVQRGLMRWQGKGIGGARQNA